VLLVWRITGIKVAGLADGVGRWHTFELPIVVVGDLDEDVVLLPDPERTSFVADELSVADWRILGYSHATQDIELIDEAVVHGFIFSFKAERIYTHHIVKFIIPLFLIVAMSWVVFWIDPTEAGSQLSVAVTAALTLIAYHIALAGKLPVGLRDIGGMATAGQPRSPVNASFPLMINSTETTLIVNQALLALRLQSGTR